MPIKCPTCKSDNPETSTFCADCGTRLPPPGSIDVTKTMELPKEELTRGITFAGRYEIIEELGKGGMGNVYRVEDKKTKEELALKLIKPEISADKKTIERFSNELRLAHKISHRNVCRMFHLGEAGGTHYITMEYVAGEDLKSVLRRMGQVPLGKAVFIAHQIAEGLAEAHRLGVIHRDLKPHNVMIDKDGNARIMDFGIARVLGASELTGEGMIVGTPDYMSPEQAEGREADARSDIYSLGVILYEMVTGQVPFEGTTPLSVAMKHKAEAPLPPKKVNPQLPDNLNHLILRCLEKKPELRYQTAEEFLTDIIRIEEALPTPERITAKRKPTVSREITVKFQPKKLVIPAIGIMSLIVIALLVWRFIPKKQPAPAVAGKPSLAVLYFENISADPSLDDWKTGLTELLITDLSQSKYINVLGSDRIYSLLKKLGLESAKKYSSDDLRRVAEEGRVTYTGSGSIMKAGENIIITFVLRNPQTGESIPPHKLECRGEAEISSKLDDLTRLIKADLNVTSAQISSDIDKELGKITTPSPEALRFYIEGRKVQAKGDQAQCIEFTKKAIALDPEFAMAYRSMALAYGNMGYSEDSEKYLKKALEFSDRTSDRERLLIQVAAEKNMERKIEIYNKILQLYPDDSIAHSHIGLIYSNYLGEFDKAIEHSEWCVKNNRESVGEVGNLCWTYTKIGLYDKAIKVLEEYLRTFPDNAYAHQCLADTYLCWGKIDYALAEAQKAFSLNPTDRYNTRLKGDIFHCRGELKKAEEEYRKLLKPEDLIASIEGRQRLALLDLLQGKFEHGISELKQALEMAEKIGDKGFQFVAHAFMGYSYLSFGHPREALEEADRALQIAESLKSPWREELFPLELKGLCYLEMNSLEEPSRIAEEIKAFNLPFYVRVDYLNIMGRIELVKKNYSRAIEYLKNAVSLTPSQHLADQDYQAYLMEPLARAYFESGDLENARKEYEETTQLTTGRIWYGDIYARSFYMLGKIYEKQGRKAEAVANYQRFLDLWKDADPGLPEVEDARKRLAGLRD